ncbi:MAG: WD40 repeat domain-containing protein [Sedimentisphaerales bacterium]|nr:WD40 repeat domain-containing protein [Sedimentisphaerales bacterium]
MAVLRFQCGKCGKWLKALEGDAGRRGKCTRCGAPVRVPIAEARPVIEPAASSSPPVRPEARGVLWELKEHPLWLAAGIAALVLLAAVIVGLKLMSGAGRQTAALMPETKSGEDYAETPGPNEPAPLTETPTTSKQQAQASPAAPAGSETPAASAPAPQSQLAAEARRGASSEEYGEMFPSWARVILDGALFPPDVTWERAEGFFRSYSESRPELREKPDQLQSAALFRPLSLGALAPETLRERYGQGVVTQETQGRGKTTWYSYGLLSFGVKEEDKHFSEIRAPIRLFVDGFVKSAQQAGVAKPSAFFDPDRAETSEATEVTIVNKRTVAIEILIGGAGPCRVDPGHRKIVRLSPAYYPVEVSSASAAATMAAVPAFPRARWEVIDDAEGRGLGSVRLAAEPSTSGGPTGSGLAQVKIVNGHDSPLKVQVGCDGRCYRLKPKAEVEIRAKTNTYVVCVEDGTRSAYEAVEASGSVVWSVAAGQGPLPFKVTVTPGPPVADAGIPVASSAVTPICPIDPSELAARRLLLAGHGEAVSCVVFSPDGSKILSSGRDNALHLWDMTSRDANDQFVRKTIRGRHTPAAALAFGPNGESVWSSDASGREIVCHDVDTGEELGGLALRTYPAGIVVFSHQTQKALLAARALFLWDLETGELLQQWKLPGEAGDSDIITACDLSPDDRYALCGDVNGQLTMIDMNKGTITWSLQAHEARITAAAFSPEGRLAVSGSEDGTVCVWDLETQKERVSLQGHTTRVTAVAFAPDAKKVLSASFDKTIRVWDVEQGDEIGCLEEHTGPVLCASFSPEGALVVSGSEDCTVRVWKTPEETPIVAKPAPEPERMPNAAIIATTQVAPAISGTESSWWVSRDGELHVRQPGGKEFVWVQIRLGRGVKWDSHGFRLTDANDREIGRLVTTIDSTAYQPVFFPPAAMKLNFVRGRGVQPDRATSGLLYDLAVGAMFKPLDHMILLIFDADRDSGTQCYLRGDDVREPLQLRPYRSGRTVLPRSRKTREPEPLPDRNRLRGSR